MAADFRKAQIVCLRSLLRTAIRFCVRSSLTIQDLLEAAKYVFLEFAAEEIENTGKRVTMSRLSVVTGIHRKDVSRIQKQGDEIRESSYFVTRVLSMWGENKEFLTSANKPRILGVGGEDSEFGELVSLVSSDLKPGTVLFELERMGAVERVKGGIRLRRDYISLKGKPDEAYHVMGRDTEDLSLAIEENIIQQPEIPNLHIRTEYDNVYQSAVPKIRKWLIEEGSKFHRRAREYVAKYDKDIHPGQGPGGGRVLLGSFSRVEDD